MKIFRKSFKKLCLIDKRGVVVVEAVFILPILIIILFCVIEISRFVIAHNRAEATAMSMANILTQTDEYSLADLQNTILPITMRPFDPEQAGAIITRVTVEENVDGMSSQVAASTTVEQFGFVDGSTVTASDLQPLAALNAPGNYVAVETFYNYSPLVGSAQTAVQSLLGLGAVRSKKILVDRRSETPRQRPSTPPAMPSPPICSANPKIDHGSRNAPGFPSTGGPDVRPDLCNCLNEGIFFWTKRNEPNAGRVKFTRSDPTHGACGGGGGGGGGGGFSATGGGGA